MTSGPRNMEMVPARDVARELGVKTSTLATWRCRGEGPDGAVKAGSTLVLYQREAVERFKAERAARIRPPAFLRTRPSSDESPRQAPTPGAR